MPANMQHEYLIAYCYQGTSPQSHGFGSTIMTMALPIGCAADIALIQSEIERTNAHIAKAIVMQFQLLRTFAETGEQEKPAPTGES